ncbi:hypothetical protein DIPPA_32784, partial [Diplonema papillatum]
SSRASPGFLARLLSSSLAASFFSRSAWHAPHFLAAVRKRTGTAVGIPSLPSITTSSSRERWPDTRNFSTTARNPSGASSYMPAAHASYTTTWRMLSLSASSPSLTPAHFLAALLLTPSYWMSTSSRRNHEHDSSSSKAGPGPGPRRATSLPTQYGARLNSMMFPFRSW